MSTQPTVAAVWARAGLRVLRADTPLRRMRGLLGKSALSSGEGLLIVPCNAIHTLGMRFAIDARFYDRHGRLIRTVLNIRPGRLWIFGGFRAHSVLECAAGDKLIAAAADVAAGISSEQS